jgi:4'-phosphopantetheinyl transferase
VVAFVRDGRVGIDIEDCSRSLGIESVARLVLHPEEFGDGRRHGRDALVHTWVQKESILKASGEGIRLPMSGMYLADDRLEEWDAHPEYVGKVELSALEAPPGLIGAAALIPPL